MNDEDWHKDKRVIFNFILVVVNGKNPIRSSEPHNFIHEVIVWNNIAAVKLQNVILYQCIKLPVKTGMIS